MATTPLGKLFGGIDAVLDSTGLEAPLSTGGDFQKDISLDTGSHKLSLFDTPVTIDATLNAGVHAYDPGKAPDSPFPNSALKAPDNTQYTALTIGGKISAAADVNATPGVLTVSASASAKTDFSYAHLLPVASTSSRLAAFLSLGSTTTLPQLVDVTKLAPGEVLDFAATLNVDFGLKATYGKVVDVNGVISLLEGLGDFPLPFKAHVAFAANASFGFSLYESTRVTVGLAATSNAGWARIRLDREHRSRITFGAGLDITIDYDPKAGAQALLDKEIGRASCRERV